MSLASHADVLRSSSRVPAPPTSDETSGYKRILNIYIYFHALTARAHPAAKGLAERHVWELKDKLSRNTGEFANKFGQVFACAQGYAHRFRDVTQGTTYEQTVYTTIQCAKSQKFKTILR